jgi:hypothetical protein
MLRMAMATPRMLSTSLVDDVRSPWGEKPHPPLRMHPAAVQTGTIKPWNDGPG